MQQFLLEMKYFLPGELIVVVVVLSNWISVSATKNSLVIFFKQAHQNYFAVAVAVVVEGNHLVLAAISVAVGPGPLS